MPDPIADDTARLSGQHRLFNAFGTFPGRTGVELKYVLDDGDATTIDPLVTLSVKGAGLGQVFFGSDGKPDLVLDNTDAASRLFAKVGKGQPHAQLNDVAITSVIFERLKRRFPEAEIVSLGGATEAAIWSIYYRIGKVDPGWPSIPYGAWAAGGPFNLRNGSQTASPRRCSGMSRWSAASGATAAATPVRCAATSR